MVYDLAMLRDFYSNYSEKVNSARERLGHPLTLAEKILYTHLFHTPVEKGYQRGTDYAFFRPNRVAMQDATAQMALLQFMNANRSVSAVPATIHCDHLILASDGATPDLAAARSGNAEVYNFLHSAANKYGLGFWAPGSGIIHQVILENYAFPGGMMVGTDSHTPNAGGLGMLAIGVGGADAVDVMAGMEWELKMPKLIGVRLTGTLNAWTSPKDVILKLAGILTVKGGTNAIIEYFGEGTRHLSCTGKATICNMGAEVGATTSVFPYDERMSTYLKATGRAEVAALADDCQKELQADQEVLSNPQKYYDQVIDIRLDELEPQVNGPFTPDAAFPLSQMAERVAQKNFPDPIEVVLIGSCTNSSYQDLARAASVARQALDAGLKPKAELIINPGSEQIRATAERDGILAILRKAGALIMTNACGPCIGQWKRKTDDNTRRNSIVTTFNRNFAKRADGNPNTHAFITSPEVAMGYAFTGKLSESPCRLLAAPVGDELPRLGFAAVDVHADAVAQPDTEVLIPEQSQRLQRLEPFRPWKEEEWQHLPLLIKTQGKCTTDHISMAGPWLKYRGHLENISKNLLMGAVNAFNGKTNAVVNCLNQAEEAVSTVASTYQKTMGGSFVVAEDNYGEGSSREHAAMEPRFLGVKFILAKSFARIHETNLKKQGVLALTFKYPADYNKVQEGDKACVQGLTTFAPGQPLFVTLTHSDGTEERIEVTHTYNEVQIHWFKAGAALNANIQ